MRFFLCLHGLLYLFELVIILETLSGNLEKFSLNQVNNLASCIEGIILY